MNTIRRPAAALAVGAVAAGALLLPASAAEAKDNRVVATKACGSIATKLRLSPDHGRIEAEFELDQNRSGRAWSVAMRDNGRLVASGVRVTRAPSGSFGWRVLVRDGAGRDTVTVTARRGTTVCTISARV